MPDAIRMNMNINVIVMYNESIDGIMASNSAMPIEIMTHNVSYIFNIIIVVCLNQFSSGVIRLVI